MISARLGQSWGSIVQATVVAVALCCGAATAEPAAAQAAPWRLFVPPAAAATTERDFTEDSVNAAVKMVVDDRSKDGLFVFRDPKINADLSLVYEKVKIVRGMEGYGWFANTIFHDKDNDKKHTPSTSGSSRTAQLSSSWTSACRKARSRKAMAGP
jgi:hypothetical protein